MNKMATFVSVFSLVVLMVHAQNFTTNKLSDKHINQFNINQINSLSDQTIKKGYYLVPAFFGVYHSTNLYLRDLKKKNISAFGLMNHVDNLFFVCIGYHADLEEIKRQKQTQLKSRRFSKLYIVELN